MLNLSCPFFVPSQSCDKWPRARPDEFCQIHWNQKILTHFKVSIHVSLHWVVCYIIVYHAFSLGQSENIRFCHRKFIVKENSVRCSYSLKVRVIYFCTFSPHSCMIHQVIAWNWWIYLPVSSHFYLTQKLRHFCLDLEPPSNIIILRYLRCSLIK